MKSDKSNKIKEAFNQLFNSLTEEEQIESDARLIMFRFLSIVEKRYKEMGLNRNQLAKRVGTSASYITQLFRGDKMVNMIMLAKFQTNLNLKFEISDKKSYENEIENYPTNDGNGFWVYRSFSKPDYTEKENFPKIGLIKEEELEEIVA